MRMPWVVASLLAALAATSPVSALGPIFGWQRPLNNDARFDGDNSHWRGDWAPRVATDRHGTWLTV